MALFLALSAAALQAAPAADDARLRELHPWGTGRLYVSHVHRGGGRAERPDNTLETFRWCWENGSAVECDCRKTKDGVGVMLHDGTLRRTGRGITSELAQKSVPRELTWDEIKDVDVGSYLAPEYANERVPTIEATFAAMKGHPTWLCFVDEKGAGPAYIARKAVEAGVQDQVYYTGPSHEKILEWNRILPGGKSLLWIGAWPKDHGPQERARADRYFREQMKRLREKGFAHVSAVSVHSYYDPKDPEDPFVPSTAVLKEVVRELHLHGIPVVSIPFQGGEREETYFRLYDLGFDGFSTDYPSVMFSVIRQLKAGARADGGGSLPDAADAPAADVLAWPKPPPIPREQGLFRCQVHRGGGSRSRPDNSLETFLWCWGHGLAPEADARLTKDGVAIAMHDDNLKRVGRGISASLAERKIRDLAWDEIRDVDVGSYLNAQYATTRIATMESVFAAMKGRPDRILYVDEKGAPPELIAELANRFGVIEQVYYCSWNWKIIPRWRAIAPKGRSMVWIGNWPKSNSTEDIARTEAFIQKRLDAMAATGFAGIDQVQIHLRTDLSKPDVFNPSSAFIRRAIALLHKHGVTVNGVTWTEGANKDVYRKMWDLGFDHFTTDYPETLFEVVDEIRRGDRKTQRTEKK